MYRGTDLTLDRPVAVKVLRDAGDDALARHRGEIATLARLSHPRLVTLHDAGSDGDRAWFVMECVEGQTLGARLRGGPLPLRETARIGAALADAVAYVHRQGVVHRDLKPGNVLLGDGDVVKLTDFGIALVSGEARVTRTGLTVGTAAYIAPEQVEGAGTDDRVDVYSLGLVLLECLTGSRAYGGQHRRVRPGAAAPSAERPGRPAGVLAHPADRDDRPLRRRPADDGRRARGAGRRCARPPRRTRPRRRCEPHAGSGRRPDPLHPADPRAPHGPPCTSDRPVGAADPLSPRARRLPRAVWPVRGGRSSCCCWSCSWSVGESAAAPGRAPGHRAGTASAPSAAVPTPCSLATAGAGRAGPAGPLDRLVQP